MWWDARAALQEVGPLWTWSKTQPRLVFHAHSRAGICAATVVHWLTGTPVVIHLHTLAGQPWIFWLLRRLACAEIVYNSRKTCLHFYDDPTTALFLMPAITWRTRRPPKRNAVPRLFPPAAT